MTTAPTFPCPLCHDDASKSLVYQTRKKRRYWQCSSCELIFVDPSSLPTVDFEKSVYQHHENSPSHAGYVAFLQRIIAPALAYLHADMRGLDFGCGPGPTLSILLEREGIACANYDPLFFPDKPNGVYDFIFATECFEHFHQPSRELSQLYSLLAINSYLFVMTDLYDDSIDFRTWYYKCDPTHVSFYKRRSIKYICQQYGFRLLELRDERIILLQRTGG